MKSFILLTGQEMSRADALTIESGVSSAALMECAGAAVANTVMQGREKLPVAVLCGPGNNGGDGFVAARRLLEAGWEVRLGLLGAKSALKGDAALMAGLYEGKIEQLDPALLDGAGLIIDALFGTGLTRPLEGVPQALVEAANAHPSPVLSVDLPSGVNADTGAPMGSAMKADQTVTFFLKKPGHVLFPGRAYCGEVAVVDIGIEASVLSAIEPRIYENSLELWAPSFRRPGYQSHKYDRGHAIVVSGGALATGAARLAAYSALRAGAGLVTILSPLEAAAINAAQLTAVMVRKAETANEISAILEDRRFRAAAIGPGAGVGKDTREKVLAILKSNAVAVLDADALTSFGDDPETLFKALRREDVITPHEGEFIRLFKDIDIKLIGRLEAARQAAKQARAVVVLKGADTVIAAPDNRTAINTNAPPDLATAGSGDVLAGLITGLLAQGMSGFDAACAGVWFHGACGQAAGPGLIAEDLPDSMPSVLRALLASPKSTT